MKLSKFIILGATLFLLSACMPTFNKKSTSEAPLTTLTPSINPISIDSTSYTNIIDEEPINYDYQTPDDLTNIHINITAINDFHGQLDENESEYQVGIAKMANYLIDRKSKGDILIDSGDMYQGSLISNISKGKFVSEVFKYINFDAHTIGNHEFDWGDKYIKENEEIIGQRFLGANIYKYPKENNEWVKADLGQEYRIINLYKGSEAEIKVGIIGVIGKEQLSSITSLFVQDYVFLDPTEIVKNTAIKLREEMGCDIVIASYHADDPSTSIADYVPNKTYRYVDACFLAHTHEYQYKEYNGVPFVQASAYSKGVSSVSLSFNKETSEVSLLNGEYKYLYTLNLSANKVVETALNKIKSEYADCFTKTIGRNMIGFPIDTTRMSRFYAKISYERAILKGYEVDAAMFNGSRRSLKNNEFTYSDLYETHPFLNDLYILSVSEEDCYKLSGSYYGLGYKKSGISFNRNGNRYFDVLVFNYNGFHQTIYANYEKVYDKFPSAFSLQAKHTPIKLDFNCFDCALDWLINNDIYEQDVSGANFV